MFLIATFFSMAKAQGASYYVSNGGNDSNPGTIDAPWATIQRAANTVLAGDTVYVRAGVYNETVTVPNSGSASAGYITFQSYPGETAVVDGTGLAVRGRSGVINLQNPSYVIVNGFEVRNFSTSTTSEVPVGIWISGSGSYIQILNNHIHDIQTTASGCTANAFGLAVYGNTAPASINNLTISGNELDHLTTGCSESMSINGNVQNWSVTNNLIHDNNNIGIDAIGFEKTSPDPAYDQARDGLISGNTVYNITSYGNPAYGNAYSADGIYCDGCTRVTMERNLVYNVDFGIEVASEWPGKTSSYVTVRSNLVYNSNASGLTIGGYDAARGGTDHCTIVNNTLWQNDTKSTAGGEFQIQYYATNNVFKNNIVYAGLPGRFINNYTSNSPDPADVDYNLYYFSAGSSSGVWIWNGTSYTGYATYQTATGKDAHSPFADPQFLSLTTPDLHVSPTSPAVDAGIDLGPAVVGTLDFAGNPRVQGANIDIGAYEQ